MATSKKTPVLGMVERGGRVVAKAVSNVTAGRVLEFILTRADTKDSILTTDESNVYKGVERFIKRRSVNHSEMYVDGEIHANTLEGFWTLLKRAWYGLHHKYEVKFMPLYVAEACWKYNHRKMPDLFDVFIRGCFT